MASPNLIKGVYVLGRVFKPKWHSSPIARDLTVARGSSSQTCPRYFPQVTDTDDGVVSLGGGGSSEISRNHRRSSVTTTEAVCQGRHYPENHFTCSWTPDFLRYM